MKELFVNNFEIKNKRYIVIILSHSKLDVFWSIVDLLASITSLFIEKYDHSWLSVKSQIDFLLVLKYYIAKVIFDSVDILLSVSSFPTIHTRVSLSESIYQQRKENRNQIHKYSFKISPISEIIMKQTEILFCSCKPILTL